MYFGANCHIRVLQGGPPAGLCRGNWHWGNGCQLGFATPVANYIDAAFLHRDSRFVMYRVDEDPQRCLVPKLINAFDCFIMFTFAFLLVDVFSVTAWGAVSCWYKNMERGKQDYFSWHFAAYSLRLAAYGPQIFIKIPPVDRMFELTQYWLYGNK